MKYLHEIQANMNKIIRAITNSSRESLLSPLYQKLNFPKLTEIYELELAKLMNQLPNNKLPKLFQDLFCKIGIVHGHNQGLREKIFQGVLRSIPSPQILLGPPSLIGAHVVKSFFVCWV